MGWDVWIDWGDSRKALVLERLPEKVMHLIDEWIWLYICRTQFGLSSGFYSDVLIFVTDIRN